MEHSLGVTCRAKEPAYGVSRRDGGLSLRLAPSLSACSPSCVMTKKPLEPASAEAYPTSTRSAASLSLNALSSGFPSGSRPAPSATSETIVGLPSSAPPPRSLSARRNLTRSSSSLSGDSLAKRRSGEGECQCWSADNPRESRPAAQRARSARHRAHARRRLGLPARVPLPQRSAFTGEG